MESPNQSPEEGGDQTVPEGEDEEARVKAVQSHYLRCPSPSSFSMISESRFSMISGSDAESIFMEPIHLSSAIAAKQIINEELKPRGVRTESIPESMLEKAEHLMVEDLYNRVKDMIDDRSPYNTPCVLDIQRAMVQDRLEAPLNPVDEVWPNIFIGEKSVAVNKARLKRMGITHILNAAHGTGVYTGEIFYAGQNIQYMGIEVDDFADVDISTHFRTAAEFLDEALLTHKGKVLVDSMMGVSRSAVLVAAYLMIFHHMSVMEALTALRKKRAINPNEGFLKQLRQLNEMLMEERDDDDDDTLSQCSVIDARARLEEELSMMGVKARSIMVEEEEDSASVMSSVASSAAAAALRSGLVGHQNGPEQPRPGEELVLPGRGEEEDDDVGSIIREWQRRNEKYQSEEWWEAQLLSDEEEDGELLPGGRKARPSADAEDLDSVTSEDVRAVKETLKRRLRRAGSDSASTASCSSYADLWKQRLKEIEEQAAARYRKDEDNDSESTATAKTLDDDVESVLSDTSSMYNFCKRNKEKLTPLERWRIKRIQFGWNKKDGEGEGHGPAGGDAGKRAEGEATPTPAPQDVNLTAYQSWKMKQQKHLGKDDKDEIVELSRGEDSKTARRRQHREEVLERSRKTLEESQSMCGWETESSLSGSTVPLSAFWAGAGVTGPPSVANDDNISMLSGRSSVLSQARSARSQPLGLPQVPMVPVPMMQGAAGEPMVNLASIQNWIANVVTETLMQKQGEMSSRAGSVLSFSGGPGSVAGRSVDDDSASMLSGASYSSQLARGGGRAESVLSAGGASSNSGFSSRRNKITTTSVPLYSLFQDQVDLRKLDSMDKEIKSEMRDKMATYERKKITEDNKRSTLYKKKKPKEEDEEEEKEDLPEVKTATTSKGKTARSYGLSGRLNLSTALEKDKNTSIDAWLDSVRPPQRKPASSYADRTEHGSSSSPNADRGYDFHAHTDSSPNSSPEPYYPSRRSQVSSNGLMDSNSPSYRAGSSYVDSEEEREARHSEYSAKRKFLHHSQDEGGETRGRGGRREEEEDDDDDVAAFLSQTRQRSRAQAAAENENDEILTAWRAQQEAKSQK